MWYMECIGYWLVTRTTDVRVWAGATCGLWCLLDPILQCLPWCAMAGLQGVGYGMVQHALLPSTASHCNWNMPLPGLVRGDISTCVRHIRIKRLPWSIPQPWLPSSYHLTPQYISPAHLHLSISAIDTIYILVYEVLIYEYMTMTALYSLYSPGPLIPLTPGLWLSSSHTGGVCSCDTCSVV